MSAIEFRTLGTLDLRAPDGRELHSLLAQPKRIALLAYLCIAEPRGYHRRDTLLGLFWPDSDQEHARSSLRKSLHVLRHALGENVILSRGDEEVAVDQSRISCDVPSFDELFRQNRFEDAFELYHGDLLPGFFVDDAPEFEQWLQSERSRLRSSAAQAAYQVAEQLEKSGDYRAAAVLARRSMDLADTDERTLRKLISLQFKAGDRSAAIDTYEAFARRLAAEYQTEPRSETQWLIAQIRAERGLATPKYGDGTPRRDAAIPESHENRPIHRRSRERLLFAAAGLAVVISGGSVWGWMHSTPSKQVLRYTLVVDSTEPLAPELPFASRLAISPDGSRLAYTSGSPNGPDLPLLRIRSRDELHGTAVPGTE